MNYGAITPLEMAATGFFRGGPQNLGQTIHDGRPLPC